MGLCGKADTGRRARLRTWMVMMVLVINNRALSPVKNAGIPPEAYTSRTKLPYCGVGWGGVRRGGVGLGVKGGRGDGGKAGGGGGEGGPKALTVACVDPLYA